MKKRISKQIISLITAVIILVQCLSLTAFAYNDGELYTYVSNDGTEVNYYLDSYGMPYYYENGIRINLLLPLEHLKITDNNVIANLQEEFASEVQGDVSLMSEPTSYFSLQKNPVNVTSNTYTQFMTFEANSIIPTSVMRKYANHLAVHIKALNIGKKHFYNSAKATIKLYYYVPTSDCYYNYIHTGVAAKDSIIGDIFHLDSGGLSFFKIEMIQYQNNIIWFDLNVYTTTA